MSEHIEAEYTEALAVREEPQQHLAVFGTTDPVEILQTATRIADALKQVVIQKGLVKNIRGKEHPLVEAWTTLGAMLGVFPFVEWTRKLENGWEARVVVRRNGIEIGAAEAQCTRDENTWKSRDDFALRSMCQTRAVSKALRVPLGFIMTLSGFQATPAEEMPDDDRAQRTQPVQKDEKPKELPNDAQLTPPERAKLNGRIAQANLPQSWLDEIVKEVCRDGRESVVDLRTVGEARLVYRGIIEKEKTLAQEVPL